MPRVARKSVRPTVIELDVEGHELDALHGARRTLEDVRIVEFEFGGCIIDTRTYFDDLYRFFTESGFVLLRLGPAELTRIRECREHDETFRTTNYFAVRTRQS